MSRPHPPAPSRIGSVFFALGCLTVLGVTYVGGMYSARAWPTFLTWAAPRAQAREVGRRPAEPASDKRPAGPALTFYEELNAPLTPSPAPPPRPKAARPPAPAAPSGGKAGAPPAADAPPAGEPAPASGLAMAPAAAPVSGVELPARSGAPGPLVADAAPSRAATAEARPNPTAKPARGLTAAPEARFTVQVGAFNSRGPADALRARLAATGHDAFVTEVEGGGSPRYRVRVGSFSTREEARGVAQRLANERHVPTYVTTR